MAQRLIDADVVIKHIEEYWEMVKRGKPSRGMTAVMQSIKTIVNSLQTVDAEPHWIPCSERLPKMKEIVLITNDKGHVRCGQYRGVGFFSKNDGRPHWNWKGNTLETVVAWMPLPEPYEVNHE